MPGPFDGKVVLITGGGSGFGRAAVSRKSDKWDDRLVCCHAF